MRVVKAKNTLLLSICIVCAGLVGSAQAVPPVQPYPIEPFVSISIVSPSELNLGSIPQPGGYNLPAALTLHVAANCPHHVEVALTRPFTHDGGGGSISFDRSSVKMLHPVSSPVGTPPEGLDVDVELNFSVETTFADLAGSYTGAITFTIQPG